MNQTIRNTCPATKPWSGTVYGTKSQKERQVFHRCRLEPGHVDSIGKPSPHVCNCSGLKKNDGVKNLPVQSWANLRIAV